MTKNEKCEIVKSHINCIVSQFLLKLAESWTGQSLDDLEEIQRGFFENFVFSDFMLIFHQNNHKICQFLK